MNNVKYKAMQGISPQYHYHYHPTATTHTTLTVVLSPVSACVMARDGSGVRVLMTNTSVLACTSSTLTPPGKQGLSSQLGILIMCKIASFTFIFHLHVFVFFIIIIITYCSFMENYIMCINGWTFFFRIEKSRSILPSLKDALSRPNASCVNLNYFYDLLFKHKTTNKSDGNLKLVHIACHDKKVHSQCKCEIDKILLDKQNDKNGLASRDIETVVALRSRKIKTPLRHSDYMPRKKKR